MNEMMCEIKLHKFMADDIDTDEHYFVAIKQRKNFMIPLAILPQYHSMTDTQTEYIVLCTVLCGSPLQNS